MVCAKIEFVVDRIVLVLLFSLKCDHGQSLGIPPCVSEDSSRCITLQWFLVEKYSESGIIFRRDGGNLQ